MFWPGVGLVAGLELLALLLAGDGYGYHRDELYFIAAGHHLAFGFDDQPALTPLIGRASAAIFGRSPAGLRVFSAIEVSAVVLITGAIAREMGAGKRGQTIAAAGIAVSGAVVLGRLLSTATFDYFAWSVVFWLLVRLLRGTSPREWLWLGLTTGVALENKDLIVTLGAALAISILLTRRFDLLRSPWPWAGLAIAVVLAAPNVIWQAQHGWPQRELADQISSEDPLGNRVGLIPLQLAFTGLMFPLWIAGLVWLLRSPASRPWRLLGVAYIVLVVLFLISAGKGYYLAGALPLLFGAGGAAAEAWFARRTRVIVLGVVTALTAIVSAFIAFAIVPASDLDSTPIGDINENAIESVGWPQLVDQVAAVYRGLPAFRRSKAVILAGNYGEGGALALIGPSRGLPEVYAAQNAFWRFGQPPDGSAPVIAVGSGIAYLDRHFDNCRVVARINNGDGVDNEEQGNPIDVCSGPKEPWSELWPRLHYLSA